MKSRCPLSSIQALLRVHSIDKFDTPVLMLVIGIFAITMISVIVIFCTRTTSPKKSF